MTETTEVRHLYESPQGIYTICALDKDEALRYLANDLRRLQDQGYLIRDFDVDLKKLLKFCEQVGINVRLVEGGWIGVRYALVTPQGVQDVLDLLVDERGGIERLLNSNQAAYDTLVDFKEQK